MRVWLLVLAACGSSKPVPLSHDDVAIRAFQTAWERDVRPRIASPEVRRIDERMQTTDALGRYYAELHPCRDGIARLRQASLLGHSPVFYGTPDALLGRDKCWSVLFLGGMKQDVEGWLDDRGRLLVAWRIPEG
ncbi:MAG TPA: hypothetical protein VFQ53_12780 [Kofleriaceae bacterium]|nr:hypothetical protein [Kofleriaceae bacterium]